VEVKARKDLSAGHPLEAVNRRKQKQILNASKLYLQKFPLQDLFPRFDIVSILFNSSPPQIEWVKGAFGDA
jgi:putative endonuclease